MTKPGPKPKPGLRYPSGKLKPKGNDRPGAEWRRIHELARIKAVDRRLGAVIGWLVQHRVVSYQQAAAAEAYGRLRGRFDRAIGLPPRSAVSPYYGDAEVGEKRKLRDPPTDDEIEDLKWEHSTMIREAGADYAMLDRVCVDDTQPMAQEMERLCRALDRMGSFFGLIDI